MKRIPGLLLTFVLAAWMTAPGAQAPAASMPAASAPTMSARAAVVEALRDAVGLHGAGQTTEALARVDRAIAETVEPTPMEAALLQRTRGLLALQLERPAEAARSLGAALEAQVLPPAEQVRLTEALARAQFMLKNYPAAAELARRTLAQGSGSPQLHGLLLRALYLGDDFAGATREAEGLFRRGGAMPEADLRVVASAYNRLNDGAGYVQTVERLLREHRRDEYWADLLARVAQQPGWQRRHELDLYRLKRAVGALRSPGDYLGYADLAQRAGLPVEAERAIEEGFERGLLGKGADSTEHGKLRAALGRQAAEDRNGLAAVRRPSPISDARAATSVFATGEALVAAGQTERGLEWMRAALAGPHPDRALARLRLAVALARGGQRDEALRELEVLGADGTLGLLARLWHIALEQPPATK